jgi:hypothetical protein
VNLDILFILVLVKPQPVSGDVREPDRLRAAADYEVDPDSLPKGVIQFDSVRIDYPAASASR